MAEQTKAQKEANARQERIMQQWHTFANTYGKEAYEDLMEYIEAQRNMYRQYAENLAMPSPTGKGNIAISIETAGILLQSSRGLNIVKTYIDGRVNPISVVQPKKQS